MSMSTNVQGFRPPDEQWQKMKAIWDSCHAAGVDTPQDVISFFNYEAPDPAGVEVDLHKIAREWRNEYAQGYEINIDELPEGLKIIRFYNAW